MQSRSKICVQASNGTCKLEDKDVENNKVHDKLWVLTCHTTVLINFGVKFLYSASSNRSDYHIYPM